jgi:hypothetical protein
MRISSGSPIDNLLDGGVQTGLLTHVYGCAGCGKTTFALHLSITACSLGYDVLYFDTEQMFPASRLHQILDGRDPAIMQRIAVAQPLSFEEQHDQFLTLHNSGGRSWSMTNLRLIIVEARYRDPPPQSSDSRSIGSADIETSWRRCSLQSCEVRAQTRDTGYNEAHWVGNDYKEPIDKANREQCRICNHSSGYNANRKCLSTSDERLAQREIDRIMIL